MSPHREIPQYTRIPRGFLAARKGWKGWMGSGSPFSKQRLWEEQALLALKADDPEALLAALDHPDADVNEPVEMSVEENFGFWAFGSVEYGESKRKKKKKVQELLEEITDELDMDLKRFQDDHGQAADAVLTKLDLTVPVGSKTPSKVEAAAEELGIETLLTKRSTKDIVESIRLKLVLKRKPRKKRKAGSKKKKWVREVSDPRTMKHVMKKLEIPDSGSLDENAERTARMVGVPTVEKRFFLLRQVQFDFGISRFQNGDTLLDLAIRNRKSAALQRALLQRGALQANTPPLPTRQR